jgi:hypothetical protein
VNSGSSWRYSRPRLAEALERWKASGPSTELQNAVADALMDLIRDPTGWGAEDPGQPGAYQRTFRTRGGARIGILYVIPERWVVAVVDIRHEP